jgi:V8-like Glu-specific endopeptidase
LQAAKKLTLEPKKRGPRRLPMAIIKVAMPEGLQPWFVKRAAELAGAVGRVSVAGRGFGTGFLIARRTILTCRHVLPDSETADASLFELDYQRDEDGTFRPVTTVKLHPQACFFTDEALDFAVVALETELMDRSVIPLTAQSSATLGEWVSLFHHPLGGPIQLSLHAGNVIAVDDNFLYHDANTQPGSAGAPLLDQGLRLIGLHHASVPRTDERARRIGSSATGMFVANEAIRATAILATLNRREPMLFSNMNVAGYPEADRGLVVPSTSQPELTSASAVTPEVVEARASAIRDSVFISYAHADQGRRRWRERLRTFLLPFGEELDVWDDSRIATGAQWRTEIDIALKRARVAALLIGPSFLGSEFIAKNELPPLLKAAAAEGVVVLPLITNHCSYEKTELGRYQSFNDPKKPLEAMELSEQNRWLQRFAEHIDEAFRQSTGK